MSQVSVPYTITWKNGSFTITWQNNSYPSVTFSSNNYTMVATTQTYYHFGNGNQLNTLDWTKETSLGATSFNQLQLLVTRLINTSNIMPLSIEVLDTTDATSTTTGSIQTAGGLAVAKSANIGGSLTINGSLTANSIISPEFDISPVNPNLGLQCVGVKEGSLANNSAGWQMVFSSGNVGPGVIRQFWLATGTAGYTTTFISIVFDNESVPQFGPQPASNPTNNNAISLELLFANGFTQYTSFFTDKFMASNLSTTTFSGYLNVDMPFKSSFQVYLYNSSATAGNHWLQCFYEKVPTWLGYYLNCNVASTGPYSDQQTINQFSLTSPTGNGVALLGTRVFFVGGTNNWVEGRFKIYSNNNLIFTSTGSEDYFLSAYSFNTNSINHTNRCGVLYTNGSSGTNISAYRFFDPPYLPSATGSNTLSMTWTCSDPANDPSNNSTMTNVIMVYLYYM
jgi:hypothetical protein